jgi:hypothetical protein
LVGLPKGHPWALHLKATSVSASGRPAHEALPGVHLVFSLVKRWVMGTLHRSISPEHMPAYFDEWVFRFNRRHSRSRVTADTRNCPETATKLPGGGHENCPLAVMRSARHESVCLAASRG